MAIVGSVFALLGRFAGRLLNSALGWATILLFGKVEAGKQTTLLVIALGSLLWVLAIVGVAVPDVGTFMLAFVPVPDFIDEGWVRLAMLGIVLILPLVIGIAAVVMTDSASRPGGTRLIGGVLRGYPFTFVLALTIGLLAVVSLLHKLRSLARRWEDAHVAVIVKPGGYDRVLADLREVLAGAGLAVRPRPAPAILSLPPRVLDAVAGAALGGLVPDRLMLLSGQGIEVFVYPSDVAISGTKDAVARARAAIAAQLTRSPAYLTASADSERIEDEITGLAGLADGLDPMDPAELGRQLDAIDERISRLTVPFDEWETVYRERLQVERDALSRHVNGGTRDSTGLGSPRGGDAPPGPPARNVVDWFAAATVTALLVVDVAVLLRGRLAGRRG
jgi:hypothetical protein